MEKNTPKTLKFRMVLPIIRAAGLAPWSAMFAVLFVVCALILDAFEPGIEGLFNAAWVLFQAVTTIGFGDYPCVTFVGRAAVVVLSVYSVLFLALITGVVVSYCQESMKMRVNESTAHFIDQLEHLPELSKEELESLSEKVRRFERVHR